MDILTNYENKWKLQDDPDNLIDILKIKFQCVEEDMSIIEIQNQIDNETQKIFTLGNELKRLNIFEDVKIRYNAIYNIVFQSGIFLKNSMDVLGMMRGTHHVNTNIIDVSNFNYKELKPYQKLIFLLYEHFDKNNMRKIGEYCYEEINNTRAWKRSDKIIDVINKKFNMIDDWKNWLMLTSNKDMDKNLTDYMIRSYDSRFKTLETSRYHFSFKNGIYITTSDKFIPYDSYDYEMVTYNIVCCKYIDKMFTCTNIDNIQTPYLDSIFKYQDLDDEVIDINMMFIGRMLYEVGEMDNWQVIPMLIGCGGTGKSTINNIVRMFYEAYDVGVIGNNFQKTFGLSDIYDKKAFIAPEIKSDWNIDQAEFQEIVSGGKMNINIKHSTSISIEWKVPGMLGGNENPGFIDNASSIQRRVIFTRFDKKVENGDPKLSNHLENEIDCILRKCNLTYLKYVNTRKESDIWTWLPQYFVNTRKMMANTTNSLCSFLESDQVIIEESKFMPYDEFFKRFNAFCNDNNYKKPKINVDLYTAPFSKYHLDVTKITKTYPPIFGNRYKNKYFILGIDINY
jgi:hypothetical protein